MDDQESFAVFYRAHRDELHAAVTVTLGDHQLAIEAVDEAFIRAAERWDQVQDMDRPAGWVYRVAVNWASSWRRKLRRRPTLPIAALDRAHHDVLPDPDLSDQLASLPVLQRQMLVLRHALGYTVPEVAALLGVAEGTVKSGAHRARLALQDRWGVDDGTV